jgi:hypothetical protein
VGQPYVIVWDLDGTLGDFSALEKQADANEPVRILVRAGLAEALRDLSAAGFVHTLLTVASHRYAEIVLRGTGLTPYFDRVEGRGERGKGDAAGIGTLLGLPENAWPDQMLFVGDRLMFDEPQDPRIVFHLELCALTRSADDLRRLVLHLRDRGGGSLRCGFDRLGSERTGWKKFWPWTGPLPVGKPVRRSVAGVGDLVLAVRAEGCPVIGFEKPPELSYPASEHLLVPASFQPE